MGKTSDPPPQPDYQAISAADLTANLQLSDHNAIADHPYQYSPFGESTWYRDPNGFWINNVKMNPYDEQLLNQQRYNDIDRANTATWLQGQFKNNGSLVTDTSQLPAWQNYSTAGLVPMGSASSAIAGANNQGTGGELSVLNQASLGATPQAGLFNMDPTGNSTAIQNATYNLMKPQRTEARNAEVQRLKNQGLTENSPAFQTAMRRLDEGDTQAQLGALLAGQTEYGNAFNRGMGQNDQNFTQGTGLRGQLTEEQNQQYAQQLSKSGFANQANAQNFSQNLQAQNLANSIRQQGWAESTQDMDQQNALRGQMLDEQYKKQTQALNMLNGYDTKTQVQSPQFQSFATSQQGPQSDQLTAAKMAFDSQMGITNSQNAANAQATSGLMGLGQLGVSSYLAYLLAGSDIRLKTDITRIATLDNGIGIYEFRYIWGGPMRKGVMAQEVAKIKPEAVVQHESGFLMVNYGAL